MPLRHSNRSMIGKMSILFAVVIVLACDGDNPTDSVDPLDVRVFPSHVFAGGEVFLAGDWYRDSTRTFVLAADTFALTVRRVDDSTIAATLPSSENGSLQLNERIAGADVDRGLLEVHGFERTATIQIPIEAEFTPSRNPGVPFVVTGDSAGVSVINLQNDLATRYPGIGRLRYEGSGCHRIAGPTYLDGVFLVWDTLETWPPTKVTRWQLIPDTLRHGPIPPWQGSCGVAEISPMVYVHTGSEGVGAFVSVDSIDTAGNSTHFYDDILIGNKGFYWSPTGNRLVLGGLSHSGTGVIDLETRGLAYRVPSVNSVFSAAFSVDGQTILICGETSQGLDVLVSVNAATGDSLQGMSIACRSLAIDPHLGVLYAVVAEANPVVSVLVLEPNTLTLVGKIDLPATTCFYCMDGSVLFVDRASLDLILLSIDQPGGVRLNHLSLPPQAISH